MEETRKRRDMTATHQSIRSGSWCIRMAESGKAESRKSYPAANTSKDFGSYDSPQKVGKKIKAIEKGLKSTTQYTIVRYHTVMLVLNTYLNQKNPFEQGES